MESSGARGAVEDFAKALSRGLGSRLRAFLVHESGAAEGTRHEPVVFVDRVDGALLRRVRELLGEWRRHGVATPIVLDAAHLAEARDVFPLEMLELHDRHLVVVGTVDPAELLDLDQEHLRLEVEQQLKGKIIHLRAAYLAATPSPRELGSLLVGSTEGFVVPLRGLLYLCGKERPKDAAAILRAVETAFGLRLPTFRTLLELAGKGETPAGGELEALFDTYLEETSVLSRLADGLAQAR